jgi:Rieske Fe-S protein
MNELDRRTQLQRIGVCAGAVCLPGCSQQAADSRSEEPSGSPSRGNPATPLAAVSELGDVPTEVTDPLSGDPACLVKTSGKVTLLSALCTHAGCVVAWSASEEQFNCPCHRSAFATDGRVLGGPAPKPLPQLAVHVRKGMVYRE